MGRTSPGVEVEVVSLMELEGSTPPGPPIVDVVNMLELEDEASVTTVVSMAEGEGRTRELVGSACDSMLVFGSGTELVGSGSGTGLVETSESADVSSAPILLATDVDGCSLVVIDEATNDVSVLDVGIGRWVDCSNSTDVRGSNCEEMMGNGDKEGTNPVLVLKLEIVPMERVICSELCRMDEEDSA